MNISAILPFAAATATSGVRFSQTNSSAQTADKTKVGGDIQSVAAINTPQFFADRAKRAAATDETLARQGFQNNRDAGKPQSPSGDVLDLSSDTLATATSESEDKTQDSIEVKSENKTESKTENQTGNQPAAKTQSTLAEELTPEQQDQVSKLKARDAEVRAHEAAHLAAAGQFAKGGASFTYQTGPDGNRYAIGGEVSIDSGPVKGDPAATIQKAQQVQAAALAPASPSSQDQKVAAAAARMMAAAQAELAQKQSGQSETETSATSTTSSTPSSAVSKTADSVEISAEGQAASFPQSSTTATKTKSATNSTNAAVKSASEMKSATEMMADFMANKNNVEKSSENLNNPTSNSSSSVTSAMTSSVATLKMAQTQYRMMGASWDSSPNSAGRFQIVG